jgi:spore coat protein U-like protein
MHRHLYTWTLILGMSLLASPSLEARCTVRAQRVTFGQYDVFSAQPLTSTGRIVYRCQRKDRSIRIELDRGASSTYADRHMARGTEKLNYNLYLDAGATQVWGNGLENTQVYFQLNPGTG